MNYLCAIMNKNAINYYKSLEQSANEEIKSLSRNISIISTFRLIVFVGTIAAVWYLWGKTLIAISCFVIGIAVFLILVKLHDRRFRKREISEARKKIAIDNVNRINLNLNDCNNGEKYINPQHDYSYDLDIFGKSSVFSLLDTTCTKQGCDTLASWLNNPLAIKESIGDRQKAVAELAEKIDFTTNFRAYGIVRDAIDNKKNDIKSSDFRMPFWAKIATCIMLPATIAVIILSALSIINSLAIFWVFMASLLITGVMAKSTANRHKVLEDTVAALASSHHLITIIEDEDFKSPLLERYRNELSSNGVKASVAAVKLGKILDNFNQRYNAFAFLILNGFFMWDFIQLWNAERWMKRYAASLPKWNDAISQIDALSALGTFTFNNPDYIFPVQDKEERTFLAAKHLGHPLMLRDKCVCNDVAAMTDGTFQIITGANMAGKSTYLRTIGVNFILAMIGAPVCASQMTFTAVPLLTGLRTTDSLQDNKSYFFAELSRLQNIITRAENGERVLVILDEILKGTNSADKQKGSLALVSKLVKLHVAGIIATHDLLLGTLADNFPDNVSNYRFEADINGDKLSFSYKIHPGIAQNMNACFLMEKMGII